MPWFLSFLATVGECETVAGSIERCLSLSPYLAAMSKRGTGVGWKAGCPEVHKKRLAKEGDVLLQDFARLQGAGRI